MRRVLLVDDERDTRELLARALERSGYACAVAGDAAEALEAVAREPALDAVVLDVVLGDEDWGGLELLAALKRAGVRAPIVIITAYADVRKVKFALNAGAAHLLEKPFSAPQLIAALEQVIGADDASRAIEQLFERACLTNKERTVARHLLKGLTSSQIAVLERNSPKTIRQHVSEVYAKCQVRSRAELFRLVYAR